MAERVDQLIPWGYAETAISTFHAFGDRVLRESALEAGLDPQFRVLSQPEQVIFLRERLFQLPLDRFRPLGDPTRHLAALATLVSRAKDEDVSPAQYRAWAEARLAAAASEDERDEAASHLELAAFYEAHQRLLGEAGLVDFGDQIHRTLALLRERPAVLARLRARFRFVLVDEFQDTNHAQLEMLKLLAGETANLTVVGDDDQAIYRWRGAAAANLLAFRRLYPGAREVVLVENYRSTQVILDTAARLIGYNNPYRLEAIAGIDKRLRSSRAERPPGAPRALRHRLGRGRRRRRDDRRADPGGRAAEGLRGPRAQQRRRRPLPPGAERQGPPAPLQRQPRPLRARGGAPPRLVPPRPRQPRRLGLALLPRGVRGVRDARGRPPPPQPLRAAQDAPAPRGAARPAGERGPRLGLGQVPRRGRAAPRRPRAGDGRGAAAAHRRGALRLPAVVGPPGAAGEGVLGRGRGEGPEHRPLLRGGEGLRRRGRARPRARLRRAPRPAARGRGRPGGGRGRPRRGRGPRPDRAQGEGPRVPPRLPGGLRRVEVPAAAAGGPGGAARGAREGGAHRRRRRPPPGGAPPLLRRHDPRPRRARAHLRQRLRHLARAKGLPLRGRGPRPAVAQAPSRARRRPSRPSRATPPLPSLRPRARSRSPRTSSCASPTARSTTTRPARSSTATSTSCACPS